MERRAKMGISPLIIMGIIFTVLGGIFATMGLNFLVLGLYELWLVGAVFTAFGSVFLILGIVFLVLHNRKRKMAERLIASGRYVWGEVVDCVPNINIRINNRNPYFLVVRYTDSMGRSHIFKSPSLRIFRDPALIGRQVRVFYQNESFRTYYVDTEGLIPEHIEH